jgi:hypothetical protein
MNPGPPEYEAGMLTTQLWRSLLQHKINYQVTDQSPCNYLHAAEKWLQQEIRNYTVILLPCKYLHTECKLVLHMTVLLRFFCDLLLRSPLFFNHNVSRDGSSLVIRWPTLVGPVDGWIIFLFVHLHRASYTNFHWNCSDNCFILCWVSLACSGLVPRAFPTTKIRRVSSHVTVMIYWSGPQRLIHLLGRKR